MNCKLFSRETIEPMVALGVVCLVVLGLVCLVVRVVSGRNVGADPLEEVAVFRVLRGEKSEM